MQTHCLSWFCFSKCIVSILLNCRELAGIAKLEDLESGEPVFINVVVASAEAGASSSFTMTLATLHASPASQLQFESHMRSISLAHAQSTSSTAVHPARPGFPRLGFSTDQSQTQQGPIQMKSPAGRRKGMWSPMVLFLMESVPGSGDWGKPLARTEYYIDEDAPRCECPARKG